MENSRKHKTVWKEKKTYGFRAGKKARQACWRTMAQNSIARPNDTPEPTPAVYRARTRTHITHKHTHTDTYITHHTHIHTPYTHTNQMRMNLWINKWMHVFLKESESERERVCVSVRACVSVFVCRSNVVYQRIFVDTTLASIHEVPSCNGCCKEN
jgi:hypothetical protein